MNDYKDAPSVLKEFLIHLEVIQGKSAKTTKEYYYDLRTFLRFVKCKCGRASLSDFSTISVLDVTISDLKTVTTNDLYEYMYFIAKERNNSQNARARKVSSLKTFFKYFNNILSLAFYFVYAC